MNKWVKEWFKQAEYDLATARAMFKARRYIYTVFMCHLSIEKALKGLYQQALKKTPPKVHSLVYLATQSNLRLPELWATFVEQLNDLSVPTRYPEQLADLLKTYDRKRTKDILIRTEGLSKWLKAKLSE